MNLVLRRAIRTKGSRHVTLHALHPRKALRGGMLDFDPAKLRTWYWDGLRTAREVKAADLVA